MGKFFRDAFRLIAVSVRSTDRSRVESKTSFDHFERQFVKTVVRGRHQRKRVDGDGTFSFVAQFRFEAVGVDGFFEFAHFFGRLHDGSRVDAFDRQGDAFITVRRGETI